MQTSVLALVENPLTDYPPHVVETRDLLRLPPVLTELSFLSKDHKESKERKKLAYTSELRSNSLFISLSSSFMPPL